ncbi:MAG TPA: hypothetical protein VFZ56_12585 [Gemmatimonadaceae bacterium]
MTTAVAERSVAPTAAESDAIPWSLYPILASSAAIAIGLIWDISWHRTIGRDTFWSPPHVLEQLAAIVTGLVCGWVVLRTTFAGSPEERATSVRFWGFRGPLGAWVCIWATLMMISSAPFDNWWHNAYGLDVKIISPPHMVLAAGMVGIQLGAMLLAAAAQNRATDEATRRKLGYLYSISAGIILAMVATLIMEEASMANQMRGSTFYRLTAMVFPLVLVAAARGSGLKWSATIAALVYMAIELVMIWTLQLFPATPMLAPIYNPVTHMVPPPFPLLVAVPAIAIDLLLSRWKRSDWLLVPVIGIAFVALMVAVHWYWSAFMISPAARNYFFGADQWDYNVRLGPWRYQYWAAESGVTLLKGLSIAAAYATISAGIGLLWGRGMARVRR